MILRDDTKRVMVGDVAIGGGAAVTVQSMLNRNAHDFDACVKQAIELQSAGCDIIRTAVPDMQCVPLIAKLRESVSVPIVADIHFDYKLAIESVAAGASKIRINPGNIGGDDKVKMVVNACQNRNIPIRVGVNSGSVEKSILAKYGSPTKEALVESGLHHIHLLEKFGFDNIILSIKSSDTDTMFKAYTLASQSIKYPLHLGVTEAGTYKTGVLRSAAGIGGLLLCGIGDTIRVSLTDDPVKEVETAKEILNAVGLRKGGVRFISCPTCGRTEINMIELANKAQEMLKNCKKNITVAIMGCIVNGPGEAKEADIGIAGGKGCGLIFKNGVILRKVPEDKLIFELLCEIDKM